jgi:hypothetical protein
VSQLQRDLQDSLEREADLREQLKFAEEEALFMNIRFCSLCAFLTFISITGPVLAEKIKSYRRRK